MGLLPEQTAPAEIYYNERESKSYNKNSRITKIQREITERALELLDIQTEDPLILNLGCGGGLCGQVLTENGLQWIGVDISGDMLNFANENTQNLGLIRNDIGEKFPFKEEAFDYAISISAIQWLFHSFKTEHTPIKRIRMFFKSLYNTVKQKAVIQFYCGTKETEILKTEASKAGFFGGIVVDNEGTKNSKYFLTLSKFRDEKDVKQYSRKNLKNIKSLPKKYKKFKK